MFKKNLLDFVKAAKGKNTEENAKCKRLIIKKMGFTFIPGSWSVAGVTNTLASKLYIKLN